MIIRDASAKDAAAIAKVHVSSWQTTYKGLMPDEAIAARTVEQREAMWTRVLSAEDRRSITLVAEVEGLIVGFAGAGAPQGESEDFDCELYAIYLYKEAQGKGIGRALMQAAAKKLLEAGYKSMKLSVLKNNESSRGFYEKMGGTLAGEGDYPVTPEITLKTLTFTWNDIRTLVSES